MEEESPAASQQEQTPNPQPKVQFTRHENFESWYANNIQYQPSEWDLRLVFGVLDIHDGKTSIEQHTAMSLSWPQVKVMMYFLQLQITVFEKTNGKIKIPQSVMPLEPLPPSEEVLAANPAAREIYEIIKETRDAFVAREVLT